MARLRSWAACTALCDKMCGVSCINFLSRLGNNGAHGIFEELPFLDLDGDGSNELDLASNSSGGYYSTESTNILTIELPEHISENRAFDCEFSLGDGDLISESVELDFEIISSMPIVDEILETGLFYEYDDGYIQKFIKRTNYDYILLGTIVTHYKWIKWFVNMAKNYQPDAKIIVGNSVASSIPSLK